MDKQKILVICQHNSARSQIVEEILRRHAGDHSESGCFTRHHK